MPRKRNNCPNLFCYICGRFTIKVSDLKKFTNCILVVRWKTKISSGRQIMCALLNQAACELAEQTSISKPFCCSMRDPTLDQTTFDQNET